ncbi:Zinc finger, RING-type [Sesbania bispinosa]|nr:Zinc finger, RING-type [Sesbania bispinosa]
MAVEARHLNLFPPQYMTNRDMMNPIEANVNLYNNTTTQMGYSSILPLSGTTTATATETLLPPAYNSLVADSFPHKTAMKSDSGLTYNVPLSGGKRSRENSNSINNFPFPCYPSSTNKSCASSSFFSFLGEDISLQIHQQQLDINNLIAQHMEKVRMELEEKRKRQSRRLIEAIEVGVMKRLRAKEEEIDKIGKLNWALEERVKSLCMENQIWRELAQTNEATANALRNNLEQVLAQRAGVVCDDDGATVSPAGVPAVVMDDAESCCDSTDEEDDINVDGWRMLTACAGVKDKDVAVVGEGGVCTGKKIIRSSGDSGSSGGGGRLCRNCGKDESCVLILPCRHLCLCTVCGSSLHTCPICKSFKTASVHVNMS